MLPDEKVKCPATGFVKSCREIIAACECPKFVSLKMKNPQTGELVDRFGCVDSFLPLLLVENANMTRQMGAAVESFRNEVAAAGDADATLRREMLKRLASGTGLVRSIGGS